MGVKLRNLEALGGACAVVVGLAGCGGSDAPKPEPAVSSGQRGVLATIDALQTASRNDDARRICRDLFTADLARSIHRSSKRSCEAEVRRTLTSPDAQLSVQRQIEIAGSRATATIREQNGNTSKVSLVEEGGRWRIARVTPVKAQ